MAEVNTDISMDITVEVDGTPIGAPISGVNVSRSPMAANKATLSFADTDITSILYNMPGNKLVQVFANVGNYGRSDVPLIEGYMLRNVGEYSKKVNILSFSAFVGEKYLPYEVLQELDTKDVGDAIAMAMSLGKSGTVVSPADYQIVSHRAGIPFDIGQKKNDRTGATVMEVLKRGQSLITENDKRNILPSKIGSWVYYDYHAPGRTIFFSKRLETVDNTPVAFKLDYDEDIMIVKADQKDTDAINEATVEYNYQIPLVGDKQTTEKRAVTYTNQGMSLVDGRRSENINVKSNVTDPDLAYQIARSSALQSTTRKESASLSSLYLLDAYPLCDVIEIENCPFLKNTKFRVTDVSISVSSGNLNISTKLTSLNRTLTSILNFGQQRHSAQ